MRTAYVLYIEDNIVGPCLHLIRRICNPESSARPHITVRYPINRLQDNLQLYQNTSIDEIDIVEPGSFGFEDTKSATKYTVFIKCNSERLEAISYKPEFPDSIFHITLYDGRSLEFANKLLKVLQRFSWGFRVSLPNHTRLTRIEVGGYKRDRGNNPKVLPDNLKLLLQSITSERTGAAVISQLTDKQRLELTEAICAHLHNMTTKFPRVASASGSAGQKRRRDSLEIVGEEFDYYSLSSSKKLAEAYKLFVNKQPLHLTPPELAYDIVNG